MMQQNGTFSAVWTRSHQESVPTNNLELADRQYALARADQAAADGHDCTLPSSYSSIMDWDTVHLIDAAGLPVLGKTQTALRAWTRERRRQTWVTQIGQKEAGKQTIVEDAINPGALLEWNDAENRFYWRTIAYVLHTNARKHLIHKDWPPYCWICPDDTIDSQAHRFGTGGQSCVSTRELRDQITTSIRNILNEHWTPDQEYYIPGIDHNLAVAMHRPTRAIKPDVPSLPGLWSPLVAAGSDIWINARNLSDVVLPNMLDYGGHLFDLEIHMNFVRPSGRLLPRCLQRAAQLCTSTLAHHEYHPSQPCGVWKFGTLHPSYPKHEPALKIRSPHPNHDTWWMDDIYLPKSPQRWADIKMWYQTQTSVEKCFWIACYEHSVGFRTATELGVEWFHHVPTRSLQMRTELSVRQTNSSTKTALTTKTPQDIWIGVVKSDISHTEYHTWKNEWTNILRACYSVSWLCSDITDNDRTVYDERTAMISWTSGPTTCITDEQLALNRRRLELQHTTVYDAPSGWRGWPSPSKATMAWALAFSHSTKKAIRFHVAILQAIWNANREHWTRTCDATTKAIMTSDMAGRWTAINAQIKRNRQVHDRKQPAVDTALFRHDEVLRRRSEMWHQQRLHHQVVPRQTDYDPMRSAPERPLDETHADGNGSDRDQHSHNA